MPLDYEYVDLCLTFAGVRDSSSPRSRHGVAEVRAGDQGVVREPHLHHPRGPGEHELQEKQVGAEGCRCCGGLQVRNRLDFFSKFLKYS